MYNHRMPAKTYEIRLCNSCGLRYPLTEGHTFGTRCPICMGDTRLILSHELIVEPKYDQPVTLSLKGQNLKKGTRSTEAKHLAVLLDNIRSAWNVGSILRSADGFGFQHAYLCGITPTPDNEAVTKTSLGAEDSVSWSYHKDAVKLISGLKREGWQVWALEEAEHAKSLQLAPRPETNQQTVLVLGSEITGVDPELIELADEVFYIPMRGDKKSFNVAMAFSIAAYQMQK